MLPRSVLNRFFGSSIGRAIISTGALAILSCLGLGRIAHLLILAGCLGGRALGSVERVVRGSAGGGGCAVLLDCGFKALAHLHI